jgi:hypothetical protein
VWYNAMAVRGRKEMLRLQVLGVEVGVEILIGKCVGTSAVLSVCLPFHEAVITLHILDIGT